MRKTYSMYKFNEIQHQTNELKFTEKALKCNDKETYIYIYIFIFFMLHCTVRPCLRAL